ncbi:adenylate/guanylate cyclase domain-containing protein [Bradyrhizobium sp. ARR65]|uniref:adenylate/guanylate cyclase domain-containing protein n=1 Tax=Bradyrhizobium sp. ARR65 TaxID=1040989 RepID=UPI001FDA5C27|nr:adenylate/guanylate cyclase domain-containing protein [Bradyrhizobium sp. ARR65]
MAAVLAADVAGYSRLMAADEVGTLAALKACRREIIDPAIAVHKGRMVKTTGDGMLVEFASAVDAVTCAVAVQEKMGERAAGGSEPRIEFRVGINVGDIIFDGDDIFGDGVNVAARVENECEPGRVYLSDDAYRQVRGKTAHAFVDLGERSLKNIDRPVVIYEVCSAHSATVDIRPPASSGKPLSLPDRPSIAVLPFRNMSGDPEQEYFADGMVEDIITALSRFKSLFVIARNSSFTYKGKPIDIKKVGRELGVRYVLEGSVRKSGKRVRITGQLIEAATDRHLWADNFDGALEEVFDLQDQVTSSVVSLIAPRLELAEIERTKSKPTERLDSYDFYLRGTALFYQKALVEAELQFRKAIERDQDYAAAYAMAAFMLQRRQADSGVPLNVECQTEAIALARRGAKLANDDAFTLARCGHILTYLGHDYDCGISLVEQAITVNPNLGMAWYSLGWVALMCGRFERSIQGFDRMIRLSPLDPYRAHAWAGSSFAFFFLERYEEGCALATKAVQFSADAHQLAAYILNSLGAGRTREAQEAARQFLKLQPEFRASDARTLFPVRLSEAQTRMVAAFKAAGVPA